MKVRARRAMAKVKALGAGALALGLKTAVLPAGVPARLRQAQADHELRHRPSGHHFALAERIDQLRGDQWDHLVKDASVCLGRPFLRALERCGPARLKMHYAIVYRENDPVAAIAAQSLALDASLFPSRTQGGGRALALRDRGLTRVKQRVLVCGNLLGWGPQGVAVAPAAAGDETAWHGVAEALYRIRRQDVLFGQTDLVMVKDLPQIDASARTVLRRYGYQALETEPNMVLALAPQWRSFDDYLSALRSDYRKKIRKQVGEVEAAGLVVERLDGPGVRREADVLHHLYLEVHEKQRLRLITITPEWIPALAETYGDAFRTCIIRRKADAAILGFVTLLRDRDGAIGYYIGFDKAVAAARVPLYLRLLYALVEEAIAVRASWISLGRTALEPKATLGAAAQPIRCYVRHRLPGLNAVVQALVHSAPAPDQPPERRPFKDVVS